LENGPSFSTKLADPPALRPLWRGEGGTSYQAESRFSDSAADAGNGGLPYMRKDCLLLQDCWILCLYIELGRLVPD